MAPLSPTHSVYAGSSALPASLGKRWAHRVRALAAKLYTCRCECREQEEGASGRCKCRGQVQV
jgi:hypothetical protein